MRTRNLLLSAALVAAACTLTTTAGAVGPNDEEEIQSIAVWSATCEFVVHDQIDPIGEPAQPTSDHMHAFSGMESPFAAMIPADLRDVEDPNECESPEEDGIGLVLDKSAYWTPALFSTNLGTVNYIPPATILAYYRNRGVDPDAVRAFPEDFSFVWGDPTAELDDPQDPEVMEWSCVAHRATGLENEVNFGPTIPNTCPKYLGSGTSNPFYLRLHVYFPNCVDFTSWDDVGGLSIPRRVKYAEPLPVEEQDEEAGITHYCAPQEGRDWAAIPQIQVGFRWPLSAGSGITTAVGSLAYWDLTSLKIASDHLTNNQAHGVSGHIDFMSGWSDEAIDDLMKTCFWSENHTPPGTGPNQCGAVHDYDAPFYGEN